MMRQENQAIQGAQRGHEARGTRLSDSSSAGRIWMLLALILVMAISITVPAAAEQEGLPMAPVNLSARADYEGAVAVANLTWQDESDNEVGFQILRSDNGEEFKVVGFVGANTTKYQDKVGKYITGSFTYKVRAFNQAGQSNESNASSVWF